jgi:hypothetical protein
MIELMKMTAVRIRGFGHLRQLSYQVKCLRLEGYRGGKALVSLAYELYRCPIPRIRVRDTTKGRGPIPRVQVPDPTIQLMAIGSCKVPETPKR